MKELRIMFRDKDFKRIKRIKLRTGSTWNKAVVIAFELLDRELNNG